MVLLLPYLRQIKTLSMTFLTATAQVTVITATTPYQSIVAGMALAVQVLTPMLQ